MHPQRNYQVGENSWFRSTLNTHEESDLLNLLHAGDIKLEYDLSVADSTHYVACSCCFRNLGISIEAKKIGDSSSGECPKCGRTQGAKLSKEQLWTLQQKFFLAGSQVSAYYPSPIGMGGAGLLSSQFEINTWTDYLLLKDLTGVELFWYGPHLWRLGHSLLREKVEARLKPEQYKWPLDVGRDTTIDDLWDEAISVVRPTVLNQGETLFRARILAKNRLNALEYDSPPPELIRPSRFNDSTHRVFYGAFDVETCMLELKLGPNEIVRNETTIARFALRQSFRVLNLCEIAPGELEHGQYVECMALLTGLLFPREQDYFMTQSLSRHIEKRGFDGILHPSVFRYIGSRQARNLVVFGAPVRDGRIELLDINSVRVNSLNYDLGFGPVYEQQ